MTTQDKAIKKSQVKIFDDQHIRSHWDADAEMWFFSIVDVIAILTESIDPPVYWRKLKERLKKEGNETVTNCHALKMTASDGKQRLTDVANTEQLLRLIQSIPSPKAEPFKLWLAQVGYERLEETEDPEKTIDRALKSYLAKGYSKDWINQRLKTIEVRKELTDEWERCGVTGNQFAFLTDIVTRGWSGMTTKQYKQHKNLKRENLRDNMTNTELVLNLLAETATKELSKKKNPTSIADNIEVAHRGGSVAGNARKDLEAQLGESVITAKNAKQLQIAHVKKHLVRIVKAHALGNKKLLIQFDTGIEQYTIDMTDYLKKGQDFYLIKELLEDESKFQDFRLDHGAIMWTNGFDTAPEYLFFLAHKHDIQYAELFTEWGYIKK